MLMRRNLVVILGYTIISSLRLDRKRFRKVEILAIFTLGGITILFSVLRTTFLLLAIETGSSIANMDRKLSLDAYGALFSHWEDVAAVIAGCLPGLRVLWRGNHRRTVTTTAVTPSGKAPTVSGQWFRIPKPEQAAVLHSHQQDDSSLSLKEVQITNGKTAEFSHVELQALDLPLERKRGII